MATRAQTPPQQGMPTLTFIHFYVVGNANTASQMQRSFSEMSQQTTLSPSPILFHRGPASSSFPQYPPSGPSYDNTVRSFERRRTTHPHNPPMRRFQRTSEDMSERSQPHPPPRLEHRASQTLTIDLTAENDEPPAPPQDHPRPQRRPPAERQGAPDASDIIDLTDDNDVEITRVASRRLPSISDMSLIPVRHHLPPIDPRAIFMPQEPERHINRVFSDNGPVTRGYRISAAQGEIIIRPSPDFLEHIHMIGNVQALGGQMDYQRAAFVHPRPDHVAPGPAKQGFTRSPTEEDVVICPSCEEELIHDKGPEEPVAKKGGKALTRKEREEHPFWVVKGCGHVYCNHCYQNRLPSKQQPSTVNFREKIPGGKGAKGIPMCAVENCPSEVKNKDRWVGVFL